tara:strand:+ start:1024 stop:1287 length:264 start_codon:yes stop_codon:yes gene_type:complete
MTTVMAILFLAVSVVLFGAAFGLMYANIKSINEQMDKPRQKYRVPAPHPEMEGVAWGEELMVINFDDEEIEEDDDDDDGDVPAVVRR